MRSICRFALVPTLLFALLGSSPCFAQDPDEGSVAQVGETPEDRATEFRAVTGSEAEDVPGGALMVAAYGLIWLFLMLYVLRIGRQGAAVRREVDRLEKALAAASERG